MLLFSCTKDRARPDLSKSGFPQEVAEILVNKCAVGGCHNDESYQGAGGISFSSWTKMFEGNKRGSVVIPYRPDFSSLCYFVNINPSYGPALLPTMPLNSDPLSDGEYKLVKDWILQGAPDVTGKIKFADEPKRKKIYVAHFMCDEVAVFDSKTLLPMRYIRAGVLPSQEFPYWIQVSPDNSFWLLGYYCMNGLIHKYDASNDQLTGTVELGTGAWSTFCISADSKKAWVIRNSQPGALAYVDLESMSVLAIHTLSNSLNTPRGACLLPTLNKIILGNEAGNFIYSVNISDPMNPTAAAKAVDGGTAIVNDNSAAPLFFCKTDNDQYYFCGSEYSNKVRMMDAVKDSLLYTFDLPSSPRQMAVDEQNQRLYVVCPDDANSFAGTLGAVHIFDIASKTLLKKVYSGYQPYGLIIDRARKVAAVCNSNLSSGGPAPHHSTSCGGRNGYITFIDLNTLELLDKKIETANFPRHMSVRN